MDDGASGAKEVLGKAKPPMTREQYLSFQRSVGKTELYDGGSAA